MTKLTYAEQLRHPEWQKRRLQMLQQADWVCENCQVPDKTLNVHHRHYVKGRMAWQYADNELQVLCEDCHKVAHARMDLLTRLLGSADVGMPSDLQAIGLLAGYAFASCGLDDTLAQEARDVAGPAFEEGVKAYAATHLLPATLASGVKTSMEHFGFEPTPQLGDELEKWARIEHWSDI